MYMNVKKGQLKEHVNRHCAITEAQRLANSLNCKIYTVKIEATIMPEPLSPCNNDKPWTMALDKELLYMFMGGGYTPKVLGICFGRTTLAIVCRLEKYKLQSSEDCTYKGW